MNLSTALATLDPDNDEHWTGDGQPLVSIIQVAMRDDTITRKQITEAAPQFTRASVRAAGEQKATSDEPVQETAGGELKPDVQLASDTPKPETFVPAEFVPDEPMVIAEGMTGEQKAAVYDRQATEKMAEIRSAERFVDEGKLQIVTLTNEHDQLIFMREREKPSPTNMEATRAYIESQNRLRQERVEKRNEVLKGLKPEDLRKGSALDEAHRRKTIRGGRRPNRVRLG